MKSKRRKRERKKRSNLEELKVARRLKDDELTRVEGGVAAPGFNPFLVAEQKFAEGT